MEIMTSFLSIIVTILRFAVPVYLYFQAKQEKLRYPSLWILFGLFQPIISLMFFYLIIFIREEVKSS